MNVYDKTTQQQINTTADRGLVRTTELEIFQFSTITWITNNYGATLILMHKQTTPSLDDDDDDDDDDNNNLASKSHG